jgi:hypothetical protein
VEAPAAREIEDEGGQQELLRCSWMRDLRMGGCTGASLGSEIKSQLTHSKPPNHATSSYHSSA